MIPYLQDADCTLYHGDVLDVLRELPAESVDCCVTSPPYWGLRDYGQEGQLGLEPTPEQYVTRMVEVFREVRRVLAPHGTVWLNLGDSYAHNGACGGSSPDGPRKPRATDAAKQREMKYRVPPGLKVKDLVGIPWRVAFALQADGWYLRSDIIWSKPNPMPESMTDRPTKAHEYVFLFSKQPRYFFDQEAVREAHVYGMAGGAFSIKYREAQLEAQNGSRNTERTMNPAGRNIRSVWEIEQTGRAKWSKHTLDDAYFSSIDTEEQAYWLGFLYADAYVAPRHIDLQLSDKDHEHILRFRDALGSSYEPKQTNNGRTRVVLSSKRLADDLRALGFEAKMRIPDMAPGCERHFVRGLFDGDGSVWKQLPAGRSKWRYAAQFLGTERILLEVRDCLELKGKPKFHRGIHRLSIASAEELARLYEYLYRGATVLLERKRTEFPQAQHVSSDVWPIATQPYPEAHFATFPEELARRCIAAGCPEQVCRVCGKARERIVEYELVASARKPDKQAYPSPRGDGSDGDRGSDMSVRHVAGMSKKGTTLGFTDCGADQGVGREGRLNDSGPLVCPDYRPGIVLDPFMGSGTVAYVARKLGRHSIGIDLNESYLELAAKRLQQQSLFAEV